MTQEQKGIRAKVGLLELAKQLCHVHFHQMALNEFYWVAFRKTIYRTIEELQVDYSWFKEYNEMRPHQGRWSFGKTTMQTFLDALPMAREKLLPAASCQT